MSKITIENLNLFYGDFHCLKNNNLTIEDKKITALIGPSGCGKSTLLRCLNRMNDLIEGVSITGRVLIDGMDIYGRGINLIQLRKEVGMVFQKPNPFPLSVYDNVAYGPRVHGLFKTKDALEAVVAKSLSAVGLWEELKDRLDVSTLNLTLEQQQRLCIARLLAVEPTILLMDEPCSALDPYATLKIEALFLNLKERYTIVIVTHNMQQAARVSEYTGFFLLGELIEFGDTDTIFVNPKNKLTEEYITGRFG
ncbi:MAG: phosphate ABC transporter ATP-binding protein PstB [Thermodesulfovibrionales bacterium]|nr:phosphate ABC transporter ATP-binding protein PstB [Thermodesulfovibrionales bacterium]